MVEGNPIMTVLEKTKKEASTIGVEPVGLAAGASHHGLQPFGKSRL